MRSIALDTITVQNVYIGYQFLRVSALFINNPSAQLDQHVDELFATHETGSFRRYWSLYKSTCPIEEVRRFYLKIDTGNSYFNVAILGDGKIIDIDGDARNEAGGLSIRSLKAIAGVVMRSGSVQTLPHVQSATLVVITQLTGGRANGPYWYAENPEEEERLLAFVQPLIELVASN